MKGRFPHIRCALGALSLSLLAAGAAPGRQVYQLGGQGGTPWEEAGELHFLDAQKAPGAIRPLEADPGQNLAALLLERGGDVTTTSATEAIPTDWPTDRYQIVDGDSTTAFVHEPQINIYGGAGRFYTVDMRFDLGAPFPVERIRIRTRPDAPENLLREYLLWLNDGGEASQDRFGDPIWSLLVREADNLKPVIDLNFDPRLVRHIRLRPWEASVTWELAEVEVYGRGFTPVASFLSRPIDLGEAASLGNMRWSGAVTGKAKILVQTRSGRDAEPEIYWRRTGIGDQEVPFDERGAPLTASDYRFLPPNKKGRITQDTENWSVWQVYEFDKGLEGTPVLSPSPRRFVQIKIDFFSTGTEGGQVDSLLFEYSQPPLADQVIGEIQPLRVPPATRTTFTYALRTHLSPGQRGFDRLEVRTPALVDSVVAVSIEGESVEFAAADLPEGGFAVSFPRVRRDLARVEVAFEARVFRYGTAFDGVVLDSEVDEVALAVTPGNAVDEILSDGLSVRTQLEGRLLDGVEVEPNPFSPNGDGINERARLRYAILRLTGQVPVRAEILSLSGRRIRLLRQEEAGSSAYEVEWDGRDEAGQRVPPGLYLYRVQVQSASGRQEQIGAVAVVY